MPTPKPAASESEFYRLIDAIPNEALRERVSDSALTNAGDTMIERGKPDTWSAEFWEAAIDTAKLILDAPRDFYPELYR